MLGKGGAGGAGRSALEAANWIAAGVFLTGVIFAAVAASRAGRSNKSEIAQAQLVSDDRVALEVLQRTLADHHAAMMDLQLAIRELSTLMHQRRR